MSVQRAQFLLNQGRYQQAEREAGLSLAENPNDPFAHVLMSMCLLRQERFDDATRHAQEAVGLRPDLAMTHYVLAQVWTERNYLDRAVAAIQEAIALEPDDPDYHAILAQIEFAQRRWEPALSAAEAALALDPEHVIALNLRAQSLRKLGRAGAAEDELHAALQVAPENAWTHTSMGWTCLERGNRKKAMEHFREALRLDAELEAAREGVVETLRANNIVYRGLLKYFFWMQRLSQRGQWGVVLGAYILYRILRGVAQSSPTLRPWLMPLIVAYVLFVLVTWLARPLVNLALRLHPFGRLALSRDERIASNWIGGFLAAALLLSVPAFFDLETWGASAAFCLLMLLPLSATFAVNSLWPRRAMIAYTLLVGLLGAGGASLFLMAGLSVAEGLPNLQRAMTGAGGLFMLGMALGAFFSSWVANILSSISWKR